MKKLLIVFTILWNCCTVSAQTPDFLTSSEALKAQYLESTEKEEKNDLKLDWGQNKKEIKEYIKDRTEYLEGYAENDFFIFNEKQSSYLNDLVDHIASVNPSYDFSRIKIVLCDKYWPNAYSIGDGTIAINVAIVPYFESEDELAYIICHELAHYFANHSIKTLNKRFNTIKSSEYKAELKEIKKTEYGQMSKFKDFLKSNIYSQKAHSRDHEHEADSIGYLLYQNTKYCKNASMSALKKLDLMNETHFASKSHVFSMLHLDSLAAVGSKMNVSNEVSEFDDELIKSHPDVPQRVEQIALLVPPTPDSKACGPAQAKSRFDLFKRDMTIALSESYYRHKRYGRVLLYALRNIHSDDSTYYKGMASMAYYRLIEARDQHSLSITVPAPVEFKDPDYEYLLRSVYYTRLKYLEEGLVHFCKDHFDASITDERYYYYMGKMSVALEEHEFFKNVQDQYLEYFPQGQYADHFYSRSF